MSKSRGALMDWTLAISLAGVLFFLAGRPWKDQD